MRTASERRAEAARHQQLTEQTVKTDPKMDQLLDALEMMTLARAKVNAALGQHDVYAECISRHLDAAMKDLSETMSKSTV